MAAIVYTQVKDGKIELRLACNALTGRDFESGRAWLMKSKSYLLSDVAIRMAF